jgi:flagellar biosynthetic protein FliR
MTSFNLDHFLSGHVFAFVLVFSRLGPMFLLFPGIGETYVPVRVRVLLAMTMSFVFMEPLLTVIPMPPDGISDLARIIMIEVVVGLFFGSLMRLAVSSLETAGGVVAIQTGLSNAVILNPALATQSPLPSAFFSIIGVTLVFVTGLDRTLIHAVVETYSIFPPGVSLLPGDIAQTFIQTVNRSFVVGIELAAPFLVIGLLMFIALGVMQRLLPQVQLFLVAMPIQIWGGLFLMATTVAGIMTVWLSYFDQLVGAFLSH